MELLTPSHEFPYKEDSFKNLPATIPITIKNASPLETSRRLSPTSTLFPPSPTILNEQMDAYECFRLAENSDDISEILDILEPNELLLHTWSYFQHCQQTTQKLEKEARFQKDLVEDLMADLWMLGIDEILRPIITKARREDQRLTRFAQPPPSIRITTQPTITWPDNPTPDTSFSTFTRESISPLPHFRALHECGWSTGLCRSPAKNYPQITHPRLQVILFPRVMANPGIEFWFSQYLQVRPV